ncbi:MAG: lamin tail domain-containing protein [Candidatus Cloacimonetes bacterium]|nr:lamin tail domain-containing protein [Candidatus Cloacimonadota bacterium]
MKKTLLVSLVLLFTFQICFAHSNKREQTDNLGVSIIGSKDYLRTLKADSVEFLTPNCLQNPITSTNPEMFGIVPDPVTLTTINEIYVWQPGWSYSWIADFWNVISDKMFYAIFGPSPYPIPNGPTNLIIADSTGDVIADFMVNETVPSMESSPDTAAQGETVVLDVYLNNTDANVTPITTTSPFGMIHTPTGTFVTSDDWNTVDPGINYQTTFSLPSSIPVGDWLLYMIFDWDDFEYNVNTTFTITEPFVSPGDIIISEIMQNPDAVTDANGEWFEIYNSTNEDIDINGWTVHDYGSDSFTISNGGSLYVPAEDYLVLGNNADPGTNGVYTCDYEYPANFYLANGDDELVLESDTKSIIDVVEWDGGPDWPDPTGASMVFIGDCIDDNNDYSFWTTATYREPSYTGSTGDLGSPGTAGALVEIDDQPNNDYYSETKLIGNFPNPAQDVTTIKYQLKGIANDQNTTIAIYNILGELLETVKGNNGEATLDTSNFTSGIYFYKLESGEQIEAKKLLIIR